MNPRLAVAVLALVLQPGVAAACSPGLVEPLAALDGPDRGADRFAQVLLAEVVGLRAPQRIAELAEWQQARQDTEQLNAETRARERAQRENWQPQPGGPPLPPPQSPLPPPVLPLAFEPRAEVSLVVLERLLGSGPAELQVAAGGPCGSIPRLGQQQLVLIDHGGAAHLFSRPGDGGHLQFDAAELQQIRDCLQHGACRGPASGGREGGWN